MSIQSNLCSRLVVSGALILTVLIATATTPLQAQVPGLYAGLMYGADLDVEFDGSSLNSRLDLSRNVSNNVDVVTDGEPVGLLVGYELFGFFSVEGRFGKWTDWCVSADITGVARPAFTSPLTPVSGRISHCVEDAYYAAAFARVGFKPIPLFNPYLLAGIQSIGGDSIEKEEATFSGLVSITSDIRSTFQEDYVVIGAGVEIGPKDKWGIRVEYRLSKEDFDTGEDTSVVGAGFVYHF